MARLTAAAAAVAVVGGVADEPNQYVNHGRSKFVHEYLQQRDITCTVLPDMNAGAWRDEKPASAPYLSSVNVRTLWRQSCCRRGVPLYV